VPGEDRQKVEIRNRADGGVLYWLARLYTFAGLIVTLGLVLTAVCTYGYFARRAPEPPDLATYARDVPGVTRMYAGDGTLLGSFAVEWREIAAYEEIPKQLVDAFLAAEDHEFFSHRGIYFKGILRAAWRNIVAGDFAQGGSTITQQVAKQFLGSEKSLTRKAKEAIVARRLEARYSKRAILALYLNQIYLGHGSYGVRAAARRYFSKEMEQLTLAQSALIAGMAQAPSRYSPTANPERAMVRRNLVLDKMARHGFITAADAEVARAEPLGIEPYAEQFGEVSPYFAEHVRRYLVDRYGSDELFKRGLVIETTIDPIADGAAYENVDYSVHKQDKRQGWRGPEAYLEGKRVDIFIERMRDLYGDAPLEDDRRYLGLVENVQMRGAVVRIADRQYDLPLENMKWASPWSRTEPLNDIEILSAKQALRPGDVVWVSADTPERGKFREWYLAGTNPHWLIERPHKDSDADKPVELQLEQWPHPQAAILTADHETGYVKAMVGGHNYAQSQFNRAVQACRQPASTYKPIYYSAALAEGYGYDTLLNDQPRAEVDPVTGEVWIPQNLYGLSENKVTLEYALVFSKNVPSVAIFKKVGADNVEKWARKLGFSTTIIADKALALGASCTNLDELTRAFAIFARSGRWIEFVTVRRILERDGTIVEDNTVTFDPMLRPRDRLDRFAAVGGVRAKQAIPERAAFLTTKLLRSAIKHGFATVVRQTGVNAAGKTGTSSETMDTSFVAFTSRWITSVWLGDDLRVRPLGLHDAAYMTVVPMWARYMAEVTLDHPNEEIPWVVPEGLSLKDRGGTKGEQALEPMELKWHKRDKPPENGG
jgi:penicillin-binding protein 1A